MKRFLATLTVALAVAGCGRIHHVDPTAPAAPLDALNRSTRGRRVRVVLVDGTTLEAESVHVESDSTWLFVVSPVTYRRSISSSEIRSMAVKSRAGGAASGALVGMLVGAGAGAAIGGAAYEEPNMVSRGETVAGMALILGALGVVGGLITGVIVGSEIVYLFGPN